MGVLSVCMCVHHVHAGPVETQEGITWNCRGLQRVVSYQWVLGIKPQFPGRAVCDFNHLAVFLVSVLFLTQTSCFNVSNYLCLLIVVLRELCATLSLQ